jgi:5-methylcytosine-specific restriction protein A
VRYRNPVPIKMLGNRVATADIRTAQQPKKRADPELTTPEHHRWRQIVCDLAGWQCESIEGGTRCRRSKANGDRMIADHIIERADGGALFDPANGQCLCTQHNTLKGTQARARRMASPSRP